MKVDPTGLTDPSKGGTSMKKYACNNCVFTITCEELPEDFVCPVCGSDAE